MPKRPTGQGNAVLQMGRTKLQRQAHDLLLAHGFEFERRSGHGANLYRHPDGRSEHVNATPRNPTNEYNRLKRSLRGGEPTEGIDVSTTTESAVNPVTLYVSMSDPFLLKTPANRLEIQARQQALVGWIKRVVDRHGPLLTSDLYAAAEQMGFKERQLRIARVDAGVFAYVIPGASRGKGRGSAVVWLALAHQVPEEASIVGRKRNEAEPNGVASVREDAPPISMEAVREVVGTPSERDAAAALSLETAAAAITGVPASTSAQVSSENRDGVAAAAQLLLGELGVKMPGEEAREELRKAIASLHAAEAAALRARGQVQLALESLQ